MTSFSCQHHSASLRIFLVFVILLLNAPAGLCSCCKRIFSFGDSIIDTGNYANGPSMEFPFGMTYFKRPTGRISDGRVLIDFYAQALQLPLIPPNLPDKDTEQLQKTANLIPISFLGEKKIKNELQQVLLELLAVLGSTAMPNDYFNKWNHSVPMWCHLGMQMGWFKDLLHRIAPKDASLIIVLGEIGGNDYNFWFHGNRAREEAGQFIPDIMAIIGSSIQDLIRMGAKVIMIPNNFPIGCVPKYLRDYKSANRADYDEHGCLRWFNDFSQRHNQALRGVVDRLSAQNPGVKLIYADYVGAAMEFVKNPHRFGIGDPLTACCGGDEQPYHTNKGGFANWDGVHTTEKAYEVISQGVLNGPFANPPLLRTC
uniref:SGNH hydrolase-type esterase domain-containing protein n=1 Tax=Setaria italica TaxID=4555 RepID=K3XS31_SETIT